MEIATIHELCQVADVKARRRLHSSSSSSLTVSRTRLSTIGDQAFPVAAARVWNSLPDHVTSAPSVAVFRSRLKTHLFNISYPSPLWLYSACAVTFSFFGHFNRSCLLACFLAHSVYSERWFCTICRSLIVSRILYALPAWGGFLSVELKGRINAFLRRLYKYGFMHSVVFIGIRWSQTLIKHAKVWALP